MNDIRILGFYTCFGAHADPYSHLPKSPRSAIFSATAERFDATPARSIWPSKLQLQTVQASPFTHRAPSAPFKVHRLPCGRLPSSRCIRSALSETIKTRAVLAGAPDTALRLLGSYSVSVSALAKMHSPRSANFRWVKAWGSRPSRRPAPVLACRYTPGRSSICHFER